MQSETPATNPTARMSIGDRTRALREATKRLARGRTEEQVTTFLTKKGFTAEEAQNALVTMQKDIDAKRPAFVSKQRRRKAFAIFLIVFGVALFGLGIAVGRPQTIIISAVNIGLGIKKYSDALNETFASTLP